MAKSPEDVAGFLTRAPHAHLKKGPPKSGARRASRRSTSKLGGKKADPTSCSPPDRYYLEDRVRESKYKLELERS
jgi:hypothetical protein